MGQIIRSPAWSLCVRVRVRV